MGEAGTDALRVDFDRSIKLEFHGARISSDAGLFSYRELAEAMEPTKSLDSRKFFHGDAVFAIPELYAFLEAEGYRYAIRLKANPVIETPGPPASGQLRIGSRTDPWTRLARQVECSFKPSAA